MKNKIFEVIRFIHNNREDINHQLRVAELVGNDENLILMALLHDEVEDGYCSILKIAELTDDWIAACVDLLTRKKDDKYFDYIDKIIKYGHIDVIKVKLADSTDNYLREPTTEKHLSLKNRYLKVMNLLKPVINKYEREQQ